MLWLTERERVTLAVLGLVGLAGLGVRMWQEQRPPLRVVGPSSPGEQAAWDQALERARRVDVNTATVTELERLPDIGPTLAQAIVEDRARRGPFAVPQELTRVKGIGPKTLEALDPYVTTE